MNTETIFTTNDTGLIILWIGVILFLCLKIGSVCNRKLTAYFRKHSSIKNWVDSFFFIWVMIVAEQYMAWWWAMLIAFASELFIYLIGLWHKKK